MKETGERLQELLLEGMDKDEAIAKLEQSEQVLITYSANSDSYDELSMDLRRKFQDKGLGFKNSGSGMRIICRPSGMGTASGYTSRRS